MIYSKIVGLQWGLTVGAYSTPSLTNPPAPKFASQGDALIKFPYYPLAGTFPI